MKESLTCAHCSGAFERPLGQTRHRQVFCSKDCHSASRRFSNELKRDLKAAYDREYRASRALEIKANKRAWHEKNYDPARARAVREQNAEAIAAYKREYFADPANRVAKSEYDLTRRATRYGEFADCYRLLRELEREIRRREPSGYERAKQRGYYERPQTKTRKRNVGCK